MTDELLIEAVCSSHRDRGPDGSVRWDPAWHDLDAAGRREAFERTVATRAIEAALDPRGRSGTVNVVLARIRGLPG